MADEFDLIMANMSHPITTALIDAVDEIADLIAQGEQVHGCKARSEVLTAVIAKVVAANLTSIRMLETEVRRLQVRLEHPA